MALTAQRAKNYLMICVKAPVGWYLVGASSDSALVVIFEENRNVDGSIACAHTPFSSSR